MSGDDLSLGNARPLEDGASYGDFLGDKRNAGTSAMLSFRF